MCIPGSPQCTSACAGGCRSQWKSKSASQKMYCRQADRVRSENRKSRFREGRPQVGIAAAADPPRGSTTKQSLDTAKPACLPSDLQHRPLFIPPPDLFLPPDPTTADFRDYSFVALAHISHVILCSPFQAINRPENGLRPSRISPRCVAWAPNQTVTDPQGPTAPS